MLPRISKSQKRLPVYKKKTDGLSTAGPSLKSEL